MSETDTSQLTPANDNPWYLMMTLYGEQDGEEINWGLAEKNRALSNAWICQAIDFEERAKIAEKIGIDLAETEWDESKQDEAERLFAARAKDSGAPLEIPDPAEIIELRQIVFSNTVVLEKTIFQATVFQRRAVQWPCGLSAHRCSGPCVVQRARKSILHVPPRAFRDQNPVFRGAFQRTG